MIRGIARAGAVALVAGALLGAAPAAFAATAVPGDDPDVVAAGRGYPGDPATEAPLVAAEERRIIDIRATLETSTLKGIVPTRPFRIATSGVSTIVLVARSSAYSMEELARIAPRSIEARADGSYLVADHVYVAEGATLRIAQGLTVRLASSASGFATIVADGGTLAVGGRSGVPVTIESWDASAEATDLLTEDGRAYVRVYGGHAELEYARFRDLGFWSGLTGGLSITGSVIPEPLIADDLASAAAPLEEELPLADDGTGLETLSLDGEVDGAGYASAILQGVETTGNAFGLFVTSADRVDIRGSAFLDSLVDGVVLHRDVSNSSVVDSEATGNAQDGFNLTRASSHVVFDGLRARDNGRNGITLEGRALVDGPSATGIPVTDYGDNEVRNSTSIGNGRYGIEVVGGFGISVVGNEVAGNEMGIVVSSGATDVVVRANDVTRSEKQGIALRDSGTDLTVVDNRVVDGDIGIYVRDAGGRLEENRIGSVGNHGIALVGATGSSVVVGNVVSGSGPSAIDMHRTTGTAVRDNDTGGWTSTKPLWVVIARVFQPLTVLWVAIALVLFTTWVVAGRRVRPGRDPYAAQAPLSSYTRGIVPRGEASEPRENTSGLAA